MKQCCSCEFDSSGSSVSTSSEDDEDERRSVFVASNKGSWRGAIKSSRDWPWKFGGCGFGLQGTLFEENVDLIFCQCYWWTERRDVTCWKVRQGDRERGSTTKKGGSVEPLDSELPLGPCFNMGRDVISSPNGVV